MKNSLLKPSTVLASSLSLSLTLGLPAKADPPATPPGGISLPVFCFRFTDIKEITPGSNNFRFEFEILNWTSNNANKLEVFFPNSGTMTTSGKSALNKGVIVSDALIDSDGRNLPPGPAVPIPGNVGNVSPYGPPGYTNNDWTAQFDNTPSGAFNTKKATYDAGTPIPNINLTNITTTALTIPEAINRVNTPGTLDGSGFFPNNDFNPFLSAETIDNGTNVLDGFVFEVQSFDPGDYLVYQWRMGPDVLNQAGNGIGLLARDINISASFNNPINGFPSTGFTSANLTLFAPISDPGSPLVGSENGFSGTIGAGVSLNDVDSISEVPGPLPIMGLASAFAYSRKLRRRCKLHESNSKNFTF